MNGTSSCRICETIFHMLRRSQLNGSLSQPTRHARDVARFLLFVDDLVDVATQGRGWDKYAQRFIEKHRRDQHDHGGEIDVRVLFDDYAQQLQHFHRWLQPAAQIAAGTPLQAYRDTERRFYQIATRIGWKGLIVPMMRQDPRAALERFLTPAEIAKVNAMPPGSQEQVNQLGFDLSMRATTASSMRRFARRFFVRSTCPTVTLDRSNLIRLAFPGIMTRS